MRLTLVATKGQHARLAENMHNEMVIEREIEKWRKNVNNNKI